MAGHRFEPGPIVGGHSRQPTVREFQARMAQLWEFEQRDADRCAGAPVGTDRCAGQPAPAPAENRGAIPLHADDVHGLASVGSSAVPFWTLRKGRRS